MKVDSYSIRLRLDERDYRFTGSEEIVINSDGGRIELDSVDLNIEGVNIDGAPAEFDVGEGMLAVSGVPVGRHSLGVSFDGVISQNLTGLYLAKTKESDMFTTQFESTGARRVFPCFDNPAYKAEFSLVLEVAENLTAISNMPPEKVEASSGRKTVTFRRTPPMSTYLLYIGAGKFEEKKRSYRGKEIILAAPEGHISPTDFPLDVAEKCLKLFEDYFGIEYMLPKMHLISVPEFAAGAMENWGALTFREILLFADTSTGSLTRKRIASVIAHEIAHQWFGDLVTMKWWNDLWLNESFATFMAYKMIDEIYPEMDAFGELISTRTAGALADDSLKNTHPIDVKVSDPNEVAQIFDQISYGKGASVLRMIEHFVGKGNFRDGIRDYLKSNMYSNTEGENLWASIEKVSGMPVSRVMEAWVRKEGYPVIEATYVDGKIELSQNRFMLNGSEDSSWPVPLTVLRGDRVESVLMENKVNSIPAEGFVKANAENSGFYRVMYSGELLRKALDSIGRMNYLDRWGLINDYYSFLLSAKVTLDDYLSLVGNFRKDENHLVIDEITSQLLRLHMKAPENGKIKEAAMSLVRGYLEAVGTWQEGEDMNRSILRGSLSQKLAILDDSFAEQISAGFHDLDNVDPDMRGAVILAYAVSRNDFDGLDRRLKDSGSDEERVRIISAMGWLRSEKSLEKANRMVIDGDIKRQDSMSFFSAIAAAPGSRDFAFRHIEESIDFLKRTFKGSRRASAALESIIPLVGMGRRQEMLETLERIRSPETEKGILKGRELLEINENFREKYGHL